MLKIFVNNSFYTEKLELTNNEELYKLVSVDGLNPVKNSIKSNDCFTTPGLFYTSSKDEARTLTFQFYLDSNAKVGLDMLCKYFIKDEAVTITIDSYYIDGYVETIDFDMFSDKVACQVIVQCMYPYFKSVDTVTHNLQVGIENMLEFPYIPTSAGAPYAELASGNNITIANDSNIKSGLNITLIIEQAITGFKILNLNNGSEVQVTNPDGFEDNTRVYIDTENEHKTLNYIDIYGEHSLLNFIDLDKPLLYLSVGTNVIRIECNNISETCYAYINYNFAKDWII